MGIVSCGTCMSLTLIKFLLISFVVLLFGCGGDRSHFARMNSQFIPEMQASWLWLLKNACEEYNSGAPILGEPCVAFQDEMDSSKAACEKYKTGIWHSSIQCEVLDLYDVKYKNMPALVNSRPSSPGKDNMTTP
jgi:hypothetical protein